MKISKKYLYQAVGAVSAFAVLASPVLVSAATDTANTTINANVGSTISVSSSSTVAINLAPGSQPVLSSSSDTVTVNTNNTAGYTLTLANLDTTTALESGANTIQAHTGTQAAPTVLTTGRWGYAVQNVGGFGAGVRSAETNNTSSTSTWAGVPSSAAPNTLKDTSSTATNDITTVWYGVRVDSSQPTGTYTDTVRYTATTK